MKKSEVSALIDEEPILHKAFAAGDVNKATQLLCRYPDSVFSRNSALQTVVGIAERNIQERGKLRSGPYKELIELVITIIHSELHKALFKNDQLFESLLKRTKETFPTIFTQIIDRNEGSLLWSSIPLASSKHAESYKYAKVTYNSSKRLEYTYLPPGRGTKCAELLLSEGIFLRRKYNGPKFRNVTVFNTILHAAAEWSLPEMVELLLSAGARADTVDYFQHFVVYPLFCAVISGNSKSVELILKAAPHTADRDPNIEIGGGEAKNEKASPFLRAIQRGEVLIARLFADHFDKKDFLLFEASAYGIVALVQLALEMGATNLNSALAQAVINRNVKCARLLIQAGGNVNTVVLDKEGKKRGYLLENALLRDNTGDMIILLLKSGAYFLTESTCVADKRTPILQFLEGIITKEEENEIKLLLYLSIFRWTIFLLIRKDDTAGLQTLLDTANKKFPDHVMRLLNSKNPNGFTPLKEAKEFKRTGCIRILENAKALEYAYPEVDFSQEINTVCVPSAPPHSNNNEPLSSGRRVEILQSLVDEIKRTDIDVEPIIGVCEAALASYNNPQVPLSSAINRNFSNQTPGDPKFFAPPIPRSSIPAAVTPETELGSNVSATEATVQQDNTLS